MITQVFHAVCDYCGATKDEQSYKGAQKWITDHHQQCEKFILIRKKYSGARYKVYGKQNHKYACQEIACPQCGKVHDVTMDNLLKQERRYDGDRRYIGMCGSCAVRYAKEVA